LRKAKLARDHGKWLLGKQTQVEIAAGSKRSARSFRRKTAWCWDQPSLARSVLTGEIHQAIVIDGIGIGSSVCLIARTTEFVIGWEWVAYESNEYWSVFMVQLPAPVYVVCDGQKGMLLAIKTLWPNTTVQRCRFHVLLNVRTKLTRHPGSPAGQALLLLAQDLLSIRRKREARIWKARLRRWYRKHHTYIEHQTVTSNPRARQRRWHYTHGRVRSAYRQLYKLRDDVLRSSYRPSPDLPPTSNHLEAGINSQLRRWLGYHRGLPYEHQMKLVEQYLYSRSEAAQTQPQSGQKPPRKTF